MSRGPIVLRPRVTPDPQQQTALEERQRNVRPPPDAILHRDRVQAKQRITRAVESWPALLRRQVG